MSIESQLKVGILSASLSRKAGGLYDAVRYLARNLAELPGCSLEVFGAIDEMTEQDIGGWLGVSVHTSRVVGPRVFGYVPELSRILNIAQLDILHSHGLWMFPSIGSRLWAARTRKPYVISPHGMLDPWAVKNGRLKKKLAGLLYENNHLRFASCLHALCQSEAEAIRSFGLCNPICIIPNGIDLPAPFSMMSLPTWAGQFSHETKVLLYLGRIHPKKGLRNLVIAWRDVLQKDNRDEKWVLVIAGWDQGGHEAELQELVVQMGVANSIFFIGPQFNEAKLATYQRADAFILPSFSEGLPMVVLEAWAHGLPVLMTQECNLPEGFTQDAAVKISNDPRVMAGELEDFFALSQDQHSAIGENGRQLVMEKFTWPTIAADMAVVYRWVLGSGPKPDCVILD